MMMMSFYPCLWIAVLCSLPEQLTAWELLAAVCQKKYFFSISTFGFIYMCVCVCVYYVYVQILILCDIIQMLCIILSVDKTIYNFICFYTYILHVCTCLYTRAARKVMPPTLLCWPTMSEVDVDSMAVKAEPSHQYSVTLCCCVMDGSRGAVWQIGVYIAKVCHWIPPCGEKWHPLTFMNTCWTPMEPKEWMWGSEWYIVAVATVTVGHLHRCRFSLVGHASSCSLLMKMHSY